MYAVFEWVKEEPECSVSERRRREARRRRRLGSSAKSARGFNAARESVERCKLPSGSGRSPAAKRHLVHLWSENVLSDKALNAARGSREAL